MTTENTLDTETAHLVSMANDIAVNLEFQDEAAEKIADHINRFWAPRMRRLLLEYASNDGQGLTYALKPALRKLRAG